MRRLGFCNDGTVILYEDFELIAEVEREDALYVQVADLASRFAILEADSSQVEYVTGSGERKVWIVDPAPLDSLFSEALSLVYEQRGQ